MDITLAQFRAQVGVQNYGDVVATADGKLKTVNNGIFARNFKLFQRKITQAEACETAVRFYNAIKRDFGVAADNDSTRAFLGSIATKLGITVKDGRVSGDASTKTLDRKTVKTVIQQVDAMKTMLSSCLVNVLRNRIFKDAQYAFRKLTELHGGRDEVRTLLASCNGGFVEENEAQAGDKTGKTNKPVYKNPDKAIPFLKAVLELKGDDGGYLIDSKDFSEHDNWRVETGRVIADFEQLKRLDVARYETIEDMVNDLRNGSTDRNEKKLESNVAIDYLNNSMEGLNMFNQIPSDKKIFRSFLSRLSSKLTEQGKRRLDNPVFQCRLSDEDLNRVALRQCLRTIAKFAVKSENVHYWEALKLDEKSNVFAEEIALNMKKEDYEAVFGVSARREANIMV